MRLIVRHETAYAFEAPATSVIQTLHLTPRSFEGQHIVRWRLDVDRNCHVRTSEDAFGNHTHVFVIDGPVEKLTVMVEGEVDTQDTGGVIRSAVERFPPELYLRETDLTTPDLDIAAFANEIAGRAKGGALNTLHELMAELQQRMTFDVEPTQSTTTAAEAFRLKRGVCQDLSHVFLAAARRLGMPARYVSGYFRRIDGVTQQEAGHAWTEVFVPDLGWVGFDPTNGICVTEAHVRVAIGLDYLSAAPVRGTRYGGAGEQLDVSVLVEDARAKRAFRRA